MMFSRLSLFALAAGTVALALPAHAADCTGINLGSSQTSDFTLGGVDSSACVISDQNPDQGPNGNSSGFSPDPFGSGWTLVAKVNSELPPVSLDGVSFHWGITGVPGSSGGWSIAADQSVTLDLVVAMHASNYSGAFLFDDIQLTANQTQLGTWQISWLNNGGQVPDYSNASLWVRDVSVSPVPEPTTYGLMLAGLGLVGFLARRRRSN